MLNIDMIIFIGFLLINLIVGVISAKKIRTIEDYAIGDRKFSTTALVSTIVATFVTGSIFFVCVSKVYANGLYFFIPVICIVLQMLITVYLLIPRMGEFLGSNSVAEAMGDLYGSEVRFITAICGILSMIGYIAVQFKVFGNVFNYFLGIDPTYAVFIASTIVIIYSSIGGIKAITYTDILQFITFGFVIPLIAIILWNYVDNSNFSFSSLNKEAAFDYKQVFDFDNPKFWGMCALIFYFTIPSTDPTNFQRIAMGQNIAQIKKAWLISAILFGLITISISWIPLLIKVVQPNLDSNQLIPYLVDQYASTGLKGLIIVGIFAMAMSSADSCINASAVLFANDMGKVLKVNKDPLVLSRIFSVVLGGFSIYLALAKSDLLSIVMTTSSFYLSIVTVPLLLAIFGFRSTKIPVLIGMGIGFSTILVGNILDVKADSIILGMGTNLIFFIGSHYLLRQKGGWVGIKDTKYLEETRRERAKKNKIFLEKLKNFDLIKFCKKNSPKTENSYMWFGIYLIIYTLTTMYSTHIELLRDKEKIILTIYEIMMVTGVLLAMYPIWPPRIKYDVIVQIAWNVIIFYMLIFFSCFFVMVSNFGQLQFTVFTLNILLTAILIGWKFGLCMTIIGFILSSQFYKFYAKIEVLEFMVGSPPFILMYSLMLIGSTIIILLKPKQEYEKLTEEKVDHLNGRIIVQEKEMQKAWNLRSEFIRNISHEYHAPMTGISAMADSLLAAYDKIDEKKRKAAIKDILKNSIKLEVFDSNISTLSKLAKADYHLHPENIDFSELVYEHAKLCRKLYEEDEEEREFILDIEEKIIIRGDKKYLGQLLDNLIINSITYCKKGKINITLKHTGKNIEFTISDEGIGIPTDELYEIFAEFVVSSKTHTFSGGRGVGLTLAKRVIEVHNGTIKAESDGIKGAKFISTLPIT